MNFLQKLNTHIHKLKIDKALLIAFVSLGVMILLIKLLSSGKSDGPIQEAATENFAVDTMIPAGYLLIPLEFSNAESLASLSGAFAVVDVYTAGEKGQRGFKVASAVKLLRAPLNPQQFAVLVKEENSSKVLGQEGPFFAALKNPKAQAPPPEEKVLKNPLVIHYGE